ncbi:MAG: phosphoribosyltransferase [Thermodesulfobacteriota bacterium]|jgi:hypoxanthine phosphoribosyltransferase
MPEQFRCELVSWNKMYNMTRLLAAKIKQQGFAPDMIVAIARGGCIPARILCDHLDISRLTTIQVTHYESGASKKKSAHLIEALRADIRGSKVLIVDDVNDTGQTLELALQHMQSFHPAEARVAVLHDKQVSTFSPDFYVAKVRKWRWIIYPWAVIEDVGGLLGRRATRPATPAEAAQVFAQEFACRLPRQIVEDVYALAGWTEPPADRCVSILQTAQKSK